VDLIHHLDGLGRYLLSMPTSFWGQRHEESYKPTPPKLGNIRWGIPGFVEKGWQGPPGSPSFSGFLELRVTLDGQGTGLLTAWCLMPGVPKPFGHVGDRISLTEGPFHFTDFTESEQTLEGMMFYGPGTEE
jgi:hypothetical protein